MVLESAINVLECLEGCCEDICTFCLGNINGFGISRNLLWISEHCHVIVTIIMVAKIMMIIWLRYSHELRHRHHFCFRRIKFESSIIIVVHKRPAPQERTALQAWFSLVSRISWHSRSWDFPYAFRPQSFISLPSSYSILLQIPANLIFFGNFGNQAHVLVHVSSPLQTDVHRSLGGDPNSHIRWIPRRGCY